MQAYSISQGKMVDVDPSQIIQGKTYNGSQVIDSPQTPQTPPTAQAAGMTTSSVQTAPDMQTQAQGSMPPTRTGYTAQQLEDGISKAYAAGDPKNAGVLNSMLTDELAYQKSLANGDFMSADQKAKIKATKGKQDALLQSQGSIQNLLDTYQNLGIDKLPIAGNIASLNPWSQASEYNNQRRALAATLKNIAGAGSGSGVRVNNYEMSNWANLLPTPGKTKAQNQIDLISLDKQMKANFGEGIGGDYLNRFGISATNGTYNTDGKQSGRNGIVGDTVNNIVDTAKNDYNAVANVGQDLGAGLALKGKTGQNMQASQDKALQGAQQLIDRAKTTNDPKERARLFTLANQITGGNAQDAKNMAGSFSPDVSQSPLQRGYGVAKATGDALTAASLGENIATGSLQRGIGQAIQHPIDNLAKPIIRIAANPAQAVKGLAAADYAGSFGGKLPGAQAAQEAAGQILPKIFGPKTPDATPVAGQTGGQTPPATPPAKQPILNQLSRAANGEIDPELTTWVAKQNAQGNPIDPEQILQDAGVNAKTGNQAKRGQAAVAQDQAGKNMETVIDSSPKTFSSNDLANKIRVQLKGYPPGIVDEAVAAVGRLGDIQDMNAGGQLSARQLWDVNRSLTRYGIPVIGADTTGKLGKDIGQQVSGILTGELQGAVPAARPYANQYKVLQHYIDSLPAGQGIGDAKFKAFGTEVPVGKLATIGNKGASLVQSKLAGQAAPAIEQAAQEAVPSAELAPQTPQTPQTPPNVVRNTEPQPASPLPQITPEKLPVTKYINNTEVRQVPNQKGKMMIQMKDKTGKWVPYQSSPRNFKKV